MPFIPKSKVDTHIGLRIRQRRKDWSISQQKLANILNISYQQVQKYEAGRNKVAASTLHEIAHQLDVPITYFFDGLDGPKQDR